MACGPRIYLLHLPDKYCLPVMAVLLGYSDKPEETVTGRLPAKYVVHFGEYQPLEGFDSQPIRQRSR